MKKFLTKIVCLALVFACVFVAGCTSDLASKKTLNACKEYISELSSLKEVFYADNYVYAEEGAQAAAEQVLGTEKSKFGIDYSQYENFAFYDDTFGYTLISPKILYGGAVGVLTNFDQYISNLSEEDFRLNTTYKFVEEAGNKYFKVTFKDNTVYINIENEKYSTLCIIKLDEEYDWVSVERRQVGFDDSKNINLYHYYYLEKSTNENRVFDKCEVITWRIKPWNNIEDQINAFDFDETTQKMILIEEQFETATGNVKCLTDFMQTMDFEEFVNQVDATNAVEVKVNK